MRTRLLIASAAAVTLMAGAAFAQDTAVNPSSDALPAGAATGNAAPSNGPSGQAGSGDVTAPSSNMVAPSSDSATVAPAAGAPTERAPSATAGVDTVTNGPVADTMENRKKYGMPMSNAGRHTKPAGN
jgi:hypothetical protein